MPAKKKAKPRVRKTPENQTSGGVFSPIAPNPNNPQYKLGVDEGFKKARRAIEQESPYHQLIAEKHHLHNLNIEQQQLEEQLERTKKAKNLSEEKIKGLRNQVDETLK